MPLPTKSIVRKKLNEFLRLSRTNAVEWSLAISEMTPDRITAEEREAFLIAVRNALQAGVIRKNWKTTVWVNDGHAFVEWFHNGGKAHIRLRHRELEDGRRKWDAPRDFAVMVMVLKAMDEIGDPA